MARLAKKKNMQAWTFTHCVWVGGARFDMPVNVKAVSIMMRSPLSWGYYGINSAVGFFHEMRGACNR